jgi:hypothetical protein
MHEGSNPRTHGQIGEVGLHGGPPGRYGNALWRTTVAVMHAPHRVVVACHADLADREEAGAAGRRTAVQNGSADSRGPVQPGPCDAAAAVPLAQRGAMNAPVGAFSSLSTVSRTASVPLGAAGAVGFGCADGGQNHATRSVINVMPELKG